MREKIDLNPISYLLYRILRKLKYEWKLFVYRLYDVLPILESKTKLPESVFTLWSKMAAIPGNINYMPWNNVQSSQLWNQTNAIEIANQVNKNKIYILSWEPFDVSDDSIGITDSFNKLIREIPKEYVNSFRRINWHKDYHSGYTWNVNLLFFDKGLLPKPGTDIKIPWELARFNFVGSLAHGDYVKGGHTFILQVLDFIDSNPKRKGVNWASELPVSIRAINWIWGLRLFEPIIKLYPEVAKTIIHSIYEHRKYLEKNLSYYIESTDDHYIGNCVALLYISAAFPDLPDSDEWCLFAIQELGFEMEKQILNDGYSDMMSSNYHRFIGELFASGAAIAERIPQERRIRLANLKKSTGKVKRLKYLETISNRLRKTDCCVFSDAFYNKLASIATITNAITKPNGLTSSFGDNDSARVHHLLPDLANEVRDHRHLVTLIELLMNGNSTQSNSRVLDEAQLIAGDLKLNLSSKLKLVTHESDHFKDSGIVVLRKNDIFLGITCGQNGNSGNGGHNHNDKLSFELCYRGTDIIVDGGCPVYTGNPDLRNVFRSVRSHSTAVIENLEQDNWLVGMSGLFLLQERSNPKLELVNSSKVIGQHTGYGVEHKRTFNLNNNSLVIKDEIETNQLKCLYFQFHPSIQLIIEKEQNDEIGILIMQNSLKLMQMKISGAFNPEILDGAYSEGYGRILPNKKLKVKLRKTIAYTEIVW